MDLGGRLNAVSAGRTPLMPWWRAGAPDHG